MAAATSLSSASIGKVGFRVGCHCCLIPAKVRDRLGRTGISGKSVFDKVHSRPVFYTCRVKPPRSGLSIAAVLPTGDGLTNLWFRRLGLGLTGSFVWKAALLMMGFGRFADMGFRGKGFMRVVVDYEARAEECRRLAKECKRPEDGGHFLEMAETWEMLLKRE